MLDFSVLQLQLFAAVYTKKVGTQLGTDLEFEGLMAILVVSVKH